MLFGFLVCIGDLLVCVQVFDCLADRFHNIISDFDNRLIIDLLHLAIAAVASAMFVVILNTNC